MRAGVWRERDLPDARPTRECGRYCSAAHRRCLAIIGRWLHPPHPVEPALPAPPLGGLAATAFLRRHWQKEPLLARGAIPGFTGLFGVPELVALARRDDVESRLVVRDGGRWSLAHGPFRRADFKSLPARNWTLLVQGVNLVHPAGDALLRRFSFLPFARLDDLMVSYAAPGGGVGPHVDSYDVFLLQGTRSPPLALRPPGRSRVEAAAAAEDPAAVRARARRSAGAGRHALPAAAVCARRCRDRCLHHVFDRLSRGGRDRARRRIPGLPARRTRPARTLRRPRPRARPGARRDRPRHAQTLRANAEGHCLGPDDGCPFPGLLVFGAEAACLLRAAQAGADPGGIPRPDGEARRAPGHAHTAPLRPCAPLRQRRRHAHGRRRAATTLRQLANTRSLASRRAGGMSPEAAAILYNWYRDGYVHANTA